MYCLDRVENKCTKDVTYNPKIIDLFSYKFYGGPHKGEFGIVNYNPRRTYGSLVSKQHTFNATKGSPKLTVYGPTVGNFFVSSIRLRRYLVVINA